MPLADTLDVRSLSRLFKALGEETRLRIVALLTHGELCVCHIEEALGISQPNASRQLGILRNAGVVEPRRDGNWVYYHLSTELGPECERQIHALADSFAHQDVLRRDIGRLVKGRGPEACR